MSQKTNSNGLRIGINKNWNSRWYASNGKEVGNFMVSDEKIRKYLIKAYDNAQIVKIEIERKDNKNSFDKAVPPSIDILVYCGQIGLFGEDVITVASKEIQKNVGRKYKVNLKPIAYDNVYWSARVVARKIADDIVNRVPYRMAMKNALKNVMASKALGVRVIVSGRLNGADMAATAGYTEGTVPLSTFRCDLDYAHECAQTLMGIIGVKLWINRGEIFKKGLNNQNKPEKFTLPERKKWAGPSKGGKK